VNGIHAARWETRHVKSQPTTSQHRTKPTHKSAGSASGRVSTSVPRGGKHVKSNYITTVSCPQGSSALQRRQNWWVATNLIGLTERVVARVWCCVFSFSRGGTNRFRQHPMVNTRAFGKIRRHPHDFAGNRGNFRYNPKCFNWIISPSQPVQYTITTTQRHSTTNHVTATYRKTKG
jgi:hypothetical protein